MLKRISRENPLLVAIMISISTAFLLLFFMICIGIFPIPGVEGNIIIGATIPMLISFYLFPKTLSRFILKEEKDDFGNLKNILFSIFILIIFLSIYIVFTAEQFENKKIIYMLIFHYLIVSIGEEFTYRKLILKVLSKKYKPYIAVFISAAMFAFILHINENLYVNLCIRLPLGIIFGIIANKTKNISYPIVLHTIYNLIVLII